jgi:CheY-like chemotaxis protein
MKRILILEDDRINQELIRLYLHDEYDITIVNSVKEAMEAFDRSLFNLIITDLNLGSGSDGVDFLKHVRSLQLSRQIPVIAYSAYTNPSEARGIEFSAFISKPITKSDFLNRIKAIIEEN